MESNNFYDYLLILDFEAQCKENEKLDCQEIIEFPIVVVDVNSKTISDKLFHHYVKPTVNPILFPFCTDLTGITQDKVENSSEINKVLDDLDLWIEKEFSGYTFMIVTCGDWDLKTCLKNEAEHKKINLKSYLKHWINIKRVFGDFMNLKKRPNMIEMLKYLGLPLVGRHHSGIDDSYNIAHIALEIIKAGKDFSHKYVTKERVKKD